MAKPTPKSPPHPNPTRPSGTVLNYNYGTANGTNDVISRLDNISETNGNVTTTLESYSYLGLGTVVKRAHPEDGVDLTYIKQIGESNGDAGDQYIGLDRFGRVVDQRWIDTNANNTDVDRYTYTYDRDSNVSSKENEVAWHAPLIHSDFFEAYTYDGLNRLTSTDRYNGTAADQSFALDANDNITGLTTGGTLVNRTSNDFNQLTQVGTTSLTYDAAGNMTTDDQSHTLIYDAWNRLVTVSNGNTTLATYSFDGVGRRVKGTVSGTTTDSYLSRQQVLENDVGGQATERNVFSPAYVNAILLREKDTDANGSLDQRLYFTTDANYNVTGVVSSSGTVLQRQIYDAYGDVSWKDASWGAQGSDSYGLTNLFQGMQYDGTIGWYVTPNRLYRAPLAYWNRVDPAMADGMNWFVPFADNSISRVDPKGTVQVHSLNTYKSTAGSFNVTADIFLDQPAPAGGGYIVQQITRTETINGQTTWLRYWEAWYVKAGKRDPDVNRVRNQTDTWMETPKPGTRGQTIINGVVKFFSSCPRLGNPYSDPPLKSAPGSGFSINGSGHSGELPSTGAEDGTGPSTEPAWWNRDSDNGESAVTRTLVIQWNAIGIGGGGIPIFSGVDQNGQQVEHGYPTVVPAVSPGAYL